MLLIRRLCVASLGLAIAGCFSEVPAVPEDDPMGSTTAGVASTGVASGETPSSSGVADADDTGEPEPASSSSTSSGGIEVTGTSSGHSSSDGAETSTGGCLEGTLGCSCADGECTEGICLEGVCAAANCGNGLVEGSEACDDGNRTAQDGCEADCSVSTGVAEIASGDQHSCARFHDGRLRCWGNNTHGQLGYGNLEAVGDDETPAEVGDVPIGASVIDVACGREHTCVVLEGGAVRCWGFNNRGQLGIPAPTYTLGEDIGDEPDEVPEFLDDTNVGGVAVAVTATSWTTFVLLDDGTVRCFGQNAGFGTCGYGTDVFAIGDNEPPAFVGPIDLGGTAVSIDGHGDHACAVLEDGTVRCWGFNELGALGLGNTDVVGDDEDPSSVPALTFDAPAVEVQTGLRHTCVRLETGVVKCWGRNTLGELGLGHVDPVTTAADGAPLSLGGAVADLAVGGGHACALLESGDVRCWGDAGLGRLGYGNASNDVGDDELPSSQPVLPLSVGQVHAVETGNSFSCALVDAGEVLCWGANTGGQIAQPGVDYFGNDETLEGLPPIELE
ncbi:MAG: hypothetical protein AAGA54_04450 [Myxococcota bacterium]